MCRKPYMRGVLPFGCGQCLPCRINRRRLWTHRLILESLKHASSSFVTLTYSESHLPNVFNATLAPEDVTLWLKRLRRTVGKLRYFLVGEYGDLTERPHYHVLVFGKDFTTCVMCPHQYNRKRCDCVLFRTWDKGIVFVGDVNKDSIQYVAGYTVKKMTNGKDDVTSKWLHGRHPEFARMSLRPGIGATAMVDVARVVTTSAGCDELIRTGDVPSVLSHGKKQMPLGRYLRGKLREEVGIDEEKVKTSRLLRWSAEMCVCLEDLYRGVSEAGCNKSLERLLVESTSQEALNQKSRYEIFSKKKGVL